MLYVVTNGVCCCLQICCKEVWETLYKMVGKQRFLKFLYCTIHLFVIFACRLALFFLDDWIFFMDYIAPGLKCKQSEMFNCVWASTVYRISACLFLFDFIMVIILLICKTRVGLIVNEGVFCTKTVMIFLLFGISLQIGNNFFEFFGNVAQIFSYIFLVYQTIILIDLAYLWGIKWAKKYTQGNNIYAVLLIGFTLVMYLSSIILNIYGYFVGSNQQSEESEVQCEKWPMIVSTVCLILITLVQLLNYNKQNSLLTTSALSIYTSYWAVAAMQSEPSCIPLKQTSLYLHSVIAFLFLLMTTAGSIYGSSNEENSNEQNFIELTESNIINKKQKISEEQADRSKSEWVKWHCYMAVASLYTGMLLTDWSSADIINGKYNQTFNSFFSKIFIVLLATIIYTWTLIAPRLFPNRNFAFE